MALLFLCAAAALACSPGHTADGASMGKEERKGKGKMAVLGEPQRFTDIGTREPSGVVYHAGLKHLFVVGDEGALVELDKSARVVHVQKVKGNLEDITVHTPTGNLVILSEAKSELLYWDPVARVRKARWELDTGALPRRIPTWDRDGTGSKASASGRSAGGPAAGSSTWRGRTRRR